MSTLLDNQIDLTRDIMEMEKDLGYPTLTWNNSTYNCVTSGLKETEQLKRGAFDVDIPLMLIVRKFNYSNCNLTPVFGSVDPMLNDPVTFNNQLYFIKAKSKDPTQTFYLFELKRKKN